MKKIVFAIAVMGFFFIALTTRAAIVDFDYYVSPIDNDYVNNFHGGIFSSPVQYVQQPSGGITGGALVPDIFGSYGNDVAIFNNPLQNSVGATHNISMSFLYDSSLINPHRYNTALQFNVNPFSDGNHHISAGLRGTGAGLRLSIGGYYDCSINEPPPNEFFSLLNDHWYRLNTSIENVGGDFGELEVAMFLFDIGTNGLSAPVLVGNDFLSTFDEVFSPESQLQLSIFSEQWGGVAALDNFSTSTVPLPSSVWLLGSALFSIIIFVRNKFEWLFRAEPRGERIAMNVDVFPKQFGGRWLYSH